MRMIDVDWTRCDAHGLCSRLLPERITPDEWGYPLFSAHDLNSRELVTAARAAAAACPALALRVHTRPGPG